MKEHIVGKIVGCKSIDIDGRQGVELDVAEHEGFLKPDGFVKVQLDSRAFDNLMKDVGVSLHRKGGGGSYIVEQFRNKKISITVY
jgi:hypothetical protein